MAFSPLYHLKTFIPFALKQKKKRKESKKIKMHHQEKNYVNIVGLSPVWLNIKHFKMDFEFIMKRFFEHRVFICHILMVPLYLFGSSLTF